MRKKLEYLRESIFIFTKLDKEEMARLKLKQYASTHWFIGYITGCVVITLLYLLCQLF